MQTIHMKYQDLFSLKNKKKKKIKILECRLLQTLFGALRVKGHLRQCGLFRKINYMLFFFCLDLMS